MKIKLYRLSNMEGHDGLKMDTMKNDIREELKEEMTERFEEGFTYDDFMEDCDTHIQYKYNTHPMTKYECEPIVGNDLEDYLEMEEEACAYYKEVCGEDYTERGMVKIVPLWLLSVAEEWKNDELENLYEELTRDPLAIQQ